MARCAAKRSASASGGGALDQPSEPGGESAAGRCHPVLAQRSRVAAVPRSRPARRTAWCSPAQTVGMVLPQLLAALKRGGSRFGAVRGALRPPTRRARARRRVGPQHRGGIVEPPAGADGVDGRVRGDSQWRTPPTRQPVSSGVTTGALRTCGAQLRVGRRGGAGRPVQHVDLGRTWSAVIRWATFASGTPISVCSSTSSATTPLRARRAQRHGGLQHVVALHPPLTLRVEAPHDRAHHGHSSWYCDATRVTSTAPPQSAHAAGTGAAWVSVDPRRARAAAVAAILRTGPPSGYRGLPATRFGVTSSNCRFRCSICCFRRSCLPLQAVVLALLPLCVAARAPSTSPGAVRGR